MIKIKNIEPKFDFADIVIVENKYIGIVVKKWPDRSADEPFFDVYIRHNEEVESYPQSKLTKYLYPIKNDKLENYLDSQYNEFLD